MSTENNQLLYGFKEKLTEPIPLRAGPLRMIYERGFIRYVSYAGSEIIRIVYMALRDKNWATYGAIIENEKIISDDYSFDISYTCRHEENNETIFSWDVNLRGDETGKIVFSIKGKAVKELLKNRAGFCVLHPIKNTAGQPLTIVHSDGTEENSTFPLLISPDNPFKNIKELEWTNQLNKYKLEFKGDSFEMEDHRNWTDTSYKTFCTPLSIPFPIKLNAGDIVIQEIIFSPIDKLPTTSIINNEEAITISIESDKTTTLPFIGIADSTEISSLKDSAIKTIKEIDPDFYGIDIRTADQKWTEILRAEIQTAKKLKLQFFICLQVTNEYEKEFVVFQDVISDNESLLQYLLIIQEKTPVTEQPVIEWAETIVKKHFAGAKIGIGTYTNFTEINRNRKAIFNADFIGYAIHPQEHAFDHLSMIENLEAQADTVISTRNIYPSAKAFISSLTLRRRCNPNALDDKDRFCTNDQKADPRQTSLWGAGWALGSLKYLSESGAYAVNCFQTAGRQGLCNEEGEIYPVGCVLKMLLALKNATVIKTHSSSPLTCSSLLLEKEGKQFLFLANHTGKEIDVELPFEIKTFRDVQVFPSSIIEKYSATVSLLKLAPYQIVCLNS